MSERSRRGRWGWLWLALGAGRLLMAAAGAEQVLRQDTHWKAGGPVWVRDSLVIPPGVTLTIEPGALVLFGPHPNRSAEGGGLFIRVAGTLRAIGTPATPILFRGANPRFSPPSDWDFGKPYDTLQGWNQFQGLIFTREASPFQPESQTGCWLRDVVVEGAYEPVRVEGSRVRLERCTFLRSGAGGDRGGGVTLMGGEARDCLFEWSGGYALRVGDAAQVTNCLLEKGFGDGVRVEGHAHLSNCNIRRFAGAGIDLQAAGLELLHCRIQRCSEGIRVRQALDPPPFLYGCALLDLGWPLPGSAIKVQKPAQGPPPRFLKFDTEGGDNRILSPVAVQDEVGGVEVFLREVWWGRSDPQPSPPHFQGEGSRFHLEPALEVDPWQTTWEYRGQITDAAQRPAPGVLVWLQDSDAPPERTDGEGNYRLPGVQPGWHQFRAYRPGWGLVEAKLQWLVGTNLYTYHAQLPHVHLTPPPPVQGLRLVQREPGGALLLEAAGPTEGPVEPAGWRYDVRWSAAPLAEDGSDTSTWVRGEPVLSVEAQTPVRGQPLRWRIRLQAAQRQGYLAIQVVDTAGRASPLSASVALR